MILIEKNTDFPYPGGFDEEKIVRWLEKCAGKFQIKINNLIISFLDDSALLEINKRVFNRNDLTDTVSLSYQEGANTYSGEVYISLERVKDNAEPYQTTYFNELLRVVIHSFLHVIGYDDHTAGEKKAMRCLEDLCLDIYS
jgi:rRNA maturation RNase YbeY